jgi:hypothetical protein
MSPECSSQTPHAFDYDDNNDNNNNDDDDSYRVINEEDVSIFSVMVLVDGGPVSFELVLEAIKKRTPVREHTPNCPLIGPHPMLPSVN